MPKSYNYGSFVDKINYLLNIYDRIVLTINYQSPPQLSENPYFLRPVAIFSIKIVGFRYILFSLPYGGGVFIQ